MDDSLFIVVPIVCLGFAFGPSCADPEFCQRGSKFDNVFLVYEGIEDPNTDINGPSSAHQRNAI